MSHKAGRFIFFLNSDITITVSIKTQVLNKEVRFLGVTGNITYNYNINFTKVCSIFITKL